MLIEVLDVFEHLRDDLVHVWPLESEEDLFFAYRLQVFIFQAVFHAEFEYLAIDAAAFEVEFALFGADVLEQVAHEQNMDDCDVFHLDCEDAIDAGDETVGVLSEMIEVSREGLN